MQEKTFVGGDAHPNERRPAAKANRIWKPCGAVRRGRGGKKNEWTDCVQSNIRAFGIAEDWKSTALEDEMWVETVTEGGRRLEDAVRRGQGGEEKEWIGCVQSDIRAFGIAEGWKSTALEAEVWVETVTEGGRRFMATWRKK